MKRQELNMRRLFSGRRELLFAAFFFLFALGPSILNVVTISSKGFVLHPIHMAEGMVDFNRAIYYPVAAFWNGASPYDRETYLARYPVDGAYAPYPPSTFLFYLPFALMPVHISALIYFILTIALTVLLAYTSFKFNDLEISSASVLLVAALILLSRPGRQNLILGQVTVQVVLASYVALYYAYRAPLLSGLGLAASMLKPSFGLPLAVLILACGNRRAAVLGMAFTTIINLPLLGILLHRAGGIQPLMGDMIDTLRASQDLVDNNPSSSFWRVDAIALISRLLGSSLQGSAQLLITLAVLGLAIVGLRKARIKMQSSDTAVSASIICVAVLLSVYHQPSDLLLLILPLVALVRHRLPSAFDASYVRWFLLGLFAILALNYASTNAVLSHLRPNSEAWLILASINSVTLLIIFFTYVLITLVKRARRGTC